MGSIIDLSGQKFGRLTVLERANDLILKSGYTKLAWKCICECGNIKVIRGDALKNGQTKSCGCLNNEKRHEKKKTNEFEHENFLLKLEAQNPKYNNFEVISKYVSSKDKLQCKCKICGNEWTTSSSCLLNGTGCPVCGTNDAINKLKNTNDEFLRNFKNKNSKADKIEVLEPYNGAKTKLLCRCKDCNNKWYVTPSDLLNKHGCPNYRNHKDFINSKLVNLVGYKFGKLTVISRTTNRNKQVCWLCKCECGNTTICRSRNLLNHTINSCGCINSKMELYITQMMQKIGCNYILHKKFDDLLGVGHGKLSYDFYLPDYTLLIEVQGKQHEQPIEYYGGEDSFKIQQEHDKRKREYAESNGYRLLEIWYYEFEKIEEILTKALELDCLGA